MSFGNASKSAPRADILDRAHLDRQTLGDPALAREILNLFKAEAPSILDTLRRLCACAEHLEAADLAHRLRGSALAIGAPGVVGAAEAFEAAHPAARAAALPTLERAVAEAIAAIKASLPAL